MKFHYIISFTLATLTVVHPLPNANFLARNPCDTAACLPMFPPACGGGICSGPKFIEDASCCSNTDYQSACCGNHALECCDENEQQVAFCSQNENSNLLVCKREAPQAIFQRSPMYYSAANEGNNEIQHANCCDKGVGECSEESHQTQLSNDNGQEFVAVNRKRCKAGSAGMREQKRLFMNSDCCAENSFSNEAIGSHNMAEMDNNESEVESCNAYMNNHNVILRRHFDNGNSGVPRKRGLHLLRRSCSFLGGSAPCGSPAPCGFHAPCGSTAPCGFHAPCGSTAACEIPAPCGIPAACEIPAPCGIPHLMNQGIQSDQQLCQADCCDHAYEEQNSSGCETMGCGGCQSSFVMDTCA
ncbi:8742_t:CDS:1 [Acaulospora morrowiae]|uniref:8742_t:CDS:1 n=1 Tax=Acaulospora morrowiae TaxID=94023 RepID=A0A9N9H6T0_9GLOM|nr:8742_t:CDS:1 [Acaulospora morrowiae]